MTLQEEVDAKNQETSRQEVAEWIAKPPERYFAYVDVKRMKLTTWVGDILGSIQLGRSYRSSFGDWRRSITVQGTNGHTYHGTFYESAGDYCRIKRKKGS